MDTWDLMQKWHLVLPPSRPSAPQLTWIQNAVGRIDRYRPVAVLGSTPEFRDLLAESGFHNIYVFEKNRGFYDAMAKARIYRNAERLIHGDWLDTLASFVDTFAVILSDLTSGNVPYEARPPFYAGVTRALGHNGLFLDKVLTHDRFLAVDDLVAKYATLPLNLLHINYFSCEMLFCSELIAEAQTVDSTSLYTSLERRLVNERVRAFAHRAQMITPPGCLWWYGRQWHELDNGYCPQLVRSRVIAEEPGSPYHGYVRYFELTKED